MSTTVENRMQVVQQPQGKIYKEIQDVGKVVLVVRLGAALSTTEEREMILSAPGVRTTNTSTTATDCNAVMMKSSMKLGSVVHSEFPKDSHPFSSISMLSHCNEPEHIVLILQGTKFIAAGTVFHIVLEDTSRCESVSSNSIKAVSKKKKIKRAQLYKIACTAWFDWLDKVECFHRTGQLPPIVETNLLDNPQEKEAEKAWNIIVDLVGDDKTQTEHILTQVRKNGISAVEHLQNTSQRNMRCHHIQDDFAGTADAEYPRLGQRSFSEESHTERSPSMKRGLYDDPGMFPVDESIEAEEEEPTSKRVKVVQLDRQHSLALPDQVSDDGNDLDCFEQDDRVSQCSMDQAGMDDADSLQLFLEEFFSVRHEHLGEHQITAFMNGDLF